MIKMGVRSTTDKTTRILRIWGEGEESTLSRLRGCACVLARGCGVHPMVIGRSFEDGALGIDVFTDILPLGIRITTVDQACISKNQVFGRYRNELAAPQTKDLPSIVVVVNSR